MKKFTHYCIAGGLVLGMIASAAAQADKPADSQKTQPAAAKEKTEPKATEPGDASSDDAYTIGPQDALAINVWKEPEMSGNVPVRPDGKISLPLINDVQAAGLTPAQLAHELSERMKKYVEQPRVTVVVTQINSRRIYLAGEVRRPGAFPMLEDMTVLQAISTAGGLTQFANGKKMYILRKEDGKQTKIPVNYKAILKGENESQNITLKPGDTIVVP